MLSPVSLKKLIQKFRMLGFDGPHSGGPSFVYEEKWFASIYTKPSSRRYIKELIGGDFTQSRSFF